MCSFDSCSRCGCWFDLDRQGEAEAAAAASESCKALVVLVFDPGVLKFVAVGIVVLPSILTARDTVAYRYVVPASWVRTFPLSAWAEVSASLRIAS